MHEKQEDQSVAFNFDGFYRRHYGKAFLFAKSYVHDFWAAEDIASEALISLWEMKKKDEIRDPLAFLFSIIKNKSIDYLRHEVIRQKALAVVSEVGLRELHTRITSLEACDPEKIYTEDIKKIVKDSLRSLPAKTREIFIMSRSRNISKKEISEFFKITHKGVDYHLSKALKCLRFNLKDYLMVLILFLLNKN
jgi:RNA polymerase sigma-70 factor, Bacteroides expansion family 1